MIFMTDAQGDNLYTSPDWERFTGQAVAEAIGAGWKRSIHPDDVRRLDTMLEQAVLTHRPFTTRHRIRKIGADHVWVVSGGMPAYNPSSGLFLGFVGSITEDVDQVNGRPSFFVGRFTPPPPHPSTLPSSATDLAVDHLLLARSLVAGDTALSNSIDVSLYLLSRGYRVRH